MKRLGLIHYIIIILFFVLISGSIFVFDTYNKKKNEFKTVYNPKKAVETAESYAQIVGKIYILPDEIPTLATITDKKTLPKEAFYNNAENGDKILIFPVAHKAIIYRPTTNKIVNVSDITLDTELKKPDVAGVSVMENKKSTNSAESTPTPNH